MLSQECGVVGWAYAMPVCVLFMSGRSGIVFIPSAGSITDHSQSAKGIDPYFKSKLYVEDPGHRKPVLILLNGLSKPGELAHDINFNFCRGRDSNPQPLDRQSSALPLSYYSSIMLVATLSVILQHKCVLK